MGLFNHFPYTNFHELNIDWATEKIKELLTEGETLYTTLENWKDATDASLAAWKTQTLTDLNTWKTETQATITSWESGVITDIAAQFTAIQTALATWQAQAEAAWASTKTAAEAAQAGAEAAQTAAETARAGAESAEDVAIEAVQEITVLPWEQGRFSASAATPQESDYYIRTTKYCSYKTGSFTLSAASGYKFALYGWQNQTGTYMGSLLLNGNWTKTNSQVQYFTEFDFSDYRDYYFLVVGTIDEETAITPAASDQYTISLARYATVEDMTDTQTLFSAFANTVRDAIFTTTDVTGLLTLSQVIALNVGIGNAINPTPQSQSGYGCLIMSCKAGDKLTLNIYAGSGAARGYGFTDTNYILKRVATSSSIVGSFIAEEDGYIVVNANLNRPRSISITNSQAISTVPERIENLAPASTFRKTFHYALPVPDTYVHCTYGNYNLFTASTSASDFIDAWDALADDSDGYMSSETLGLTSDGVTPLRCYTLQPAGSNHYHGLKFIILSAQHGMEKASACGLYYAIRELIFNYRNNPSLMWLRSWCTFKIIPCMNPYGWDHNTYWNANGTNLNRNWPVPGWSASGEPYTSNYPGASPGDQIETQLAKAMVDDNGDAFWFIDYHTEGSEPVNNYAGVFWHAFGTVIDRDEYTRLGIYAAQAHINLSSNAMCVDYPTQVPSYTQCGHYSLTQVYSVQGLAANYARYIGIQGETYEGMAGWPGGARWDPTCHQANADSVLNWMLSVTRAYERMGGQ